MPEQYQARCPPARRSRLPRLAPCPRRYARPVDHAVMGIVVACPCGEVYELRPEYAGRLLECAVCGRHLRAGGGARPVRRLTADVDPAFDRDVFLLRERMLSIKAK